MVKNTIIRTLTREEQQALALCGITQDDQLARLGPANLQRDIAAAAYHFPELLNFHPEPSRLEYICRQALTGVQLPEEEAADLWQPQSLVGTGITPAHEVAAGRRFSTATGRMLVNDHHQVRMAEGLDESRRKEDPRDFSHAICSQHPIAIYLGAWATLFLYISIIILLLGVVGILIGVDYKDIPRPLLGAIVGAFLFYSLVLNLASCSTCRISIFSFRRYPRHRKAHRIPLLGYTIATALYVIFCFRFRCPSCGTSQKLLGRRRSKRGGSRKR